MEQDGQSPRRTRALAFHLKWNRNGTTEQDWGEIWKKRGVKMMTPNHLINLALGINSIILKHEKKLSARFICVLMYTKLDKVQIIVDKKTAKKTAKKTKIKKVPRNKNAKGNVTGNPNLSARVSLRTQRTNPNRAIADFDRRGQQIWEEIEVLAAELGMTVDLDTVVDEKDLRPLTMKEELAAQHFVTHGDKTAAVEYAYDVAYSKRVSLRVYAARIFKRPPVQKRVEELMEMSIASFMVTKDTITYELNEAIQLAKDQGAPAAVIKGIADKAKLHGLITDKQEVMGPGGKPLTNVLPQEVTITVVSAKDKKDK